MIGSGVNPKIPDATNAPPAISTTCRFRVIPFHVSPPTCGFRMTQMVAHIMPATAATVPPMAAIAMRFPCHRSNPNAISTASADEGAVRANTAPIAPATPQISAPMAAQNAIRLVPGVTRARANARSNFSALIQRRVSTSSRPSMPMVTYPPPNVVLPMRKKISVSFLTEGAGPCGFRSCGFKLLILVQSKYSA